MKLTPHILRTIGITFFISCASSRAADSLDHFYLHGDLGPAFTQDATVREKSFDFGGPILRFGRTKFTTQINGDLSLGYNINKSWAVELEAGVIWDPTAPDGNQFYQIPVMFNVLYQVPLGKSWKAYVGAGVGEVLSIFQLTEFDPAFHAPFREEDTSVALGYQAQAGIKYEVSRHIEIGLGYKFLGVEENSWDFIISGAPTNLKIDNLYTHTALLSFNWKF